MLKVKTYNQKGEAVGEIELADRFFGVKANKALVHQAVVAQMANERQVLAHTKGRSEVRGGGKKPWKQKGTGRARHGSSRSPIWIGGGVTFGPTKERNFKKKINKKMKQKAIFMALSDRAGNNDLIVLNKFEMAEFKTKNFNNILKALMPQFTEKRSVLIINDKKDEKVFFSGRNLVGAKIINLENINILDLLKYRKLILTVDGIKKIAEIYKN
jgi:large subunit ribosomal protein L4